MQRFGRLGMFGTFLPNFSNIPNLFVAISTNSHQTTVVPKIAVIAGAGPAGLTAAYELLKRTAITPAIF